MPAPKDLQPSGILADPAPFPFAYDTGDVDLCARFGEGEKTGAQPHSDPVSEKLIDEYGQDPLQVTEGDPLVDHQPFNLMEHG